ncbi:MAG: signal peptidase I [Chroococcales cyanobacterium]
MSKDPWLAVNFSMFFPGIGQFYAGKTVKGMIFLITQVMLLGFAFWSLFGTNGNTLVSLYCLIPITLLYFGNLLDAYFSVKQYSSSGERIPRQQKNPWFAVLLSRILPGLGQLYLKQALAGSLFLFLAVFFGILDDTFSSLLVIPPLIAAVAVYHVYLTFPQRRRLSGRSIVAVIAGGILLFRLLSGSLPHWIFQEVELFNIPSASMQPTLQIKDHIFVRKSRYYQPQRQDVIVFKAPPAAKQIDPETQISEELFYVKRVIGVPGDKVEIKQNRVYINNQPFNETYIAESPNYLWGPEFIPQDSYFVLGDNRNESFDSHVWGFVPEEAIVGHAYKIYWPPNRIQSLLLRNSLEP